MLNILLLSFFFFFSLFNLAHAYIDYGTGSYIFQILAASAIGAIFFLKSIVAKIKSILSKKENSTKEKHE